jgi:hypothetical protein
MKFKLYNMKKIVLIYGLIAGLVSCAGYMIMLGDKDINFDNGMIYGYASMLIAFALIFVATNQYRKQNGGTITFGKAFLIGLYISLIASSIYVLVWLITYYNFHPDFADKYAAYIIDKMKADGATPNAIKRATVEMEDFKIMYKKPLYAILMTYAEILPLSLIISLISAGVYSLISSNKKKQTNTI